VHKIEIDDDVYAELERNVKGFESPNDVLRRMILAPTNSQVTNSRMNPPAIPGKLAPLIASGDVLAGDTISHVQKRKGNRFSGVIEGDGYIETNLGRSKEPSPALSALVGTPIDGWFRWVHDRTGKTLKELRDKK
jgi:hypothetical protein